MTKNLLPFCGIELPTTQTNSKSRENISQINIARVLEFKEEKKEVIIRIIYSLEVLSLFTLIYFLCSFDSQGHDLSADCWSLGILIFELLTGR